MKMLKFELAEQDVTLLINMMNNPSSAQSVHWAAFINLFQQQAAPQIEPAPETTNADGVPIDMEEKN